MAAGTRRLGRQKVASKELDAQLHVTSNQSLAEADGVERGYFAAAPKAFVGFAYPTDLYQRDDDAHRSEPPPMELRPILSQIQESLDRGEYRHHLSRSTAPRLIQR
jgi:hypothetical protein